MKWHFAGREFSIANVDGAAVAYQIAGSEGLEPTRDDRSASEVDDQLEARGAELAVVTSVPDGPTDFAGLFRTDEGELLRLGLREE